MVEKCWLSREALNDMMKEGESKFPNETGGLLMGYWAESTPVITHVIGPGPNAKHQRYNFEPDYQYHTESVDRFYSDNDRKLTYLGDWHTHPCGPANLSQMDIGVMQGVRNHKEAYAPTPIMLILGNHLDRLGVYCLTASGVEGLDVETYNLADTAK